MIKTILVTGANGFMASELIKQARKRKIWVDGVSRFGKRDRLSEHFPFISSDYNIVGDVISYTSPEVVYHFAANPLVSATENMIESNVVLTEKVCKASIGRHLVFASSVSVYGCKEKTFTVDDKVDPETLYAVTKVQSEDLIRFYCKRGLNATCIRYVSNVGGGATHGVLPDIVRKIKHNKYAVNVFGEYPGSCKPYLHVADAMRATLDLRLKNGFNIINMSPDDNISVDGIVDIVQDQLKTKVIRNWKTGAVWKGDQRNFKIESDIKFQSSRDAIIMATKELI